MISIKDNRHAINRVILLIVGLLLLGYCLLTVLPWQPGGYLYDLDGSWATAMHVAFREKIQFGQDFIYTYGPYGFLQVDIYLLETYSYSFLFRLLIAIAAWAGLFRLLRHCASRGDGSAFFMLPILFFFPAGPIWMDFFQFTVITLPLLLYFYVSKKISPALVITLVAAALASLIKLTYLLLCIVFIGLITIDEIGNLKRIPRAIVIFTVSLWLFWLVAAQDVANIPAYLINGLEIIRGFGASMGFPGQTKEIPLYLLGASIFLAIVIIVEVKKRDWWRILPTLGLAALFFITFKGAFTRHDGHGMQSFFNIVPTLLIITAMLWTPIRKTSWRIGKKIKLPATIGWGISAAIFLTLGTLVTHNYLNYGYLGFIAQITEHNKSRMSTVALVMSGKSNFPAIAEQSKAIIKTENPLPPISGTVDLYPNEVGTIFAYDFDYRPRPVFQSFSAYTGKLAQLNAEHLKQPQAASNILFDLKPIEGRLASFEDGLSWLELLTRYDVTNVEGRYLLLGRNSQPRTYELKPLVDELKLTLNEWYDVPDALPLWAKINIHPNLLGKLATAALRLPRLHLEVETADGIKTIHKAIGGSMSEGFLLSPRLSDRWDFLNFASPQWQPKLAHEKVKRIRISSEEANSRFYDSTYQLSLSQLEFPRQSFEQVVGWQDWNNQITPQYIKGELRKVEIDETGQTGWDAHAPMEMLINIPEDKQTFSFGYGILSEGVENSLKENAGDGVEFKIIALAANGQEKVLFSRKIQPASNPKDRGVHQESLDISAMGKARLIMKTIPGEDNEWDWSYWTNLAFD